VSDSGWSPPEIFEIWGGHAIVYMQETSGDDPGRCFAIEAGPGDVVVVPPFWPHAVISADVASMLVLGAWCSRDYGFVYDEIRARRGMAWYCLLQPDGELSWQRNPRYRTARLETRGPRMYPELGLADRRPLYSRIQGPAESLMWISQPGLKSDVWGDFEP
jgi:glucose-6-phosphate isomerase